MNQVTISSIGSGAVETTPPLQVGWLLESQTAGVLAQPDGSLMCCQCPWPVPGSVIDVAVRVSDDNGANWSPVETVQKQIPACTLGSVKQTFNDTFALEGQTTSLSQGGSFTINATPGIDLVDSGGDIRMRCDDASPSTLSFQCTGSLNYVELDIESLNNVDGGTVAGYEYLDFTGAMPDSITPINPPAGANLVVSGTQVYYQGPNDSTNAAGVRVRWNTPAADKSFTHNTTKSAADGTDGFTVARACFAEDDGGGTVGSFSGESLVCTDPGVLEFRVTPSISGSVKLVAMNGDCAQAVSQCEAALETVSGALQYQTRAATAGQEIVATFAGLPSTGQFSVFAFYDDPCQSAMACDDAQKTQTGTPPSWSGSGIIQATACQPVNAFCPAVNATSYSIVSGDTQDLNITPNSSGGINLYHPSLSGQTAGFVVRASNSSGDADKNIQIVFPVCQEAPEPPDLTGCSIPFDCDNPSSYDQLWQAINQLAKPVTLTGERLQELISANQLIPGCKYNVTERAEFIFETSYIATDFGQVQFWGFGRHWEDKFLAQASFAQIEFIGNAGGGPVNIVSQKNVLSVTRVTTGEYEAVIAAPPVTPEGEWIVCTDAASLSGVHNVYAFGTQSGANKVIRIITRDSDGVTPVDGTVVSVVAFAP